jgi:hypothetical protein
MIRLSREHLRTQEAQAKLDQAAAEAYFRDWAQAKVPAAKYMNISSGLQVRGRGGRRGFSKGVCAWVGAWLGGMTDERSREV